MPRLTREPVPLSPRLGRKDSADKRTRSEPRRSSLKPANGTANSAAQDRIAWLEGEGDTRKNAKKAIPPLQRACDAKVARALFGPRQRV